MGKKWILNKKTVSSPDYLLSGQCLLKQFLQEADRVGEVLWRRLSLIGQELLLYDWQDKLT